MEISKELQQEIQLVQNKLKNAIRDHQISVGKLKDEPNNADVLGRIQEIQLHIVTLGRCQKQVVQRLRKEVEAFKMENTNEVKISVASLLGLNNNNHITANNESTPHEIPEVKNVTNGLDNVRLATAKEDYEETVRNGDVRTSPKSNLRKKHRSVSVETLSAEEAEVMEVVEVDDNSLDNNPPHETENPPPERKPNSKKQLNFLETLGLITMSKFDELQNRRAERKRRSTANPQFVYSNWEMPTKRKRHNYLQSTANVPQTRQTTARLNGPSPPPTTKKTISIVQPPKSTSPPTRTLTKSLIPTQKATTRPNILRNMTESRVFTSKSRIENGNGQVQLSSVAKNTNQSISNNKTVHIPGLPVGLTIERIENDSAVCINCRNPGTLTSCDKCDANYHVSCHTISPPPPRLCPKCVIRLKETSVNSTTIVKNEELAAASYASGIAGKGGEDAEINKTSCGLYKIGAVPKQQNRQQQQQQQQQQQRKRRISSRGSDVNFIPIASKPFVSSGGFCKSGNVVGDSSSLEIFKSSSNNDATAVIANSIDDATSYSTSLVIGHQLARSCVTYVPQSQSHVSYAYQLPVGSADITSNTTGQSYFIVKKIPEPGKTFDGQTIDGQTISSYQNSSGIGERGNGQFDLPPITNSTSASSHLDKLTGRLAESIARGWKKTTTRAIPGLNRIAPAPECKPIAVVSDNSNFNDMDKLSEISIKPSRNSSNRQIAVKKVRAAGRRAAEASRIKRTQQDDKRPDIQIETDQQQDIIASRKTEPKDSHSSVLHSMLTSNNEPDNIANNINEKLQRSGTSTVGNNGNSTLDENINRTELPREQTPGNEPNSSDQLIASTEHVKLEEAHLSAPLRSKLVCDADTRLVNEHPPINGLQNNARVLSNRRRTTEDRVRTPPLVRIALDHSKHERDKILMRNERMSLDSRDNSFNDNIINEPEDLDDFSLYEKDYYRIMREESMRYKYGSETDSADEEVFEDVTAIEYNAPKSTLEKILTGEEREIKDHEDTDSAEDIGEEDIEEAEEVDIEEAEEVEDEEEDQEDSPILDEDINERVNDRLRISSVAPESMQVLEQFETAMLHVKSTDSTANP